MVHSSPKVMSNAIVLANKVLKPRAESSKGTTSSTMMRAEELQDNLRVKFPSLVRPMVRSNVSDCFWLSLPIAFCKKHMPKKDVTVILVDEDEKEFEVKYLAAKNAFSGGWIAFSKKHGLIEEDVLVFQVIRHWRIKVYIVRSKGLTEIDGALSLLNLDPKPLEVVREDSAENGHSDYPLEVIMEQSGEDSDGMGSEIVGGIELPESIAREMPLHIRIKYYDLCRSRKTRLHQNVLLRLNSDLIIGIISEIVNIADSIRACRISDHNCRRVLTNWYKSLGGLEDCGMEVSFLRKRINKLVELLKEEELIAKMAEKGKIT